MFSVKKKMGIIWCCTKPMVYDSDDESGGICFNRDGLLPSYDKEETPPPSTMTLATPPRSPMTVEEDQKKDATATNGINTEKQQKQDNGSPAVSQ